MKILRSMLVSFSLYSRIPMPSFEWRDEDMRYCMPCFPAVGAVMAVLCAAAYQLLVYFDAGAVMISGILTVIPILYTGGIHMDGLLDTSDAQNSYGDRDKKLEILKDPHVGGFAVIHAAVYVLMTFVCWVELISRVNEQGCDERLIYVTIAGYVVSRIFSAISVVRFKKARDKGMVSSISGAQDGKCFALLMAELVLIIACAIMLFGAYAAVLSPALPVFVYYRYRSYREFGGVSGDTAGWFLQLCELAILICATICAIVI